MDDRVLFEGKWLSIIERDGWYQFAQATTSAGVAYILVFRRHHKTPILGRYEICPAHSDKLPTLTSITGGVNIKRDPIDVAVAEVYEEAGYHIHKEQVIDLGKVNLAKDQDTTGHLYAVDVTDLPRVDAPGDGSKGEEGSYCDWVTETEAIMCKCPVMTASISRLQMIKVQEGLT